MRGCPVRRRAGKPGLCRGDVLRAVPIDPHRPQARDGVQRNFLPRPRRAADLQEIEKQLGIKEGGITSDREYSLETVACIGACGVSPCVMINNEVEAKLTPKKVGESLRKALNDE